MKRRIILPAICLATAASASAFAPMWVRDVRISPDGQHIAFSYKGDIFTVPAAGGTALRLTSGPAYDSAPVWSPQSDRIAFASDREGGRDVFIIPSAGGNPERLTFNSAFETPEAFSPDGSEVYFSASIQDPASSVLMPSARLTELYAVPVHGGKTRQVLPTPAVRISMMPDGRFLYEDVKGMEDKWRKHHTSSVTRDIWLYDPASGNHRNLTDHPGEDLFPAALPKADKFFFLSEREGGSANVYSLGLSNPGQAKALTAFTDHPVRYLSAASTPDGDTLLAFTWNGEIYTMPLSGQPSPLKIDIVGDFASQSSFIPFSSADEATVSPDGKQVAFTVRGEIFVTSAEYPSTRQITHTPAMEYGLSWGADGRSLYYTSLRSGHAALYRADIARKDDPNFSNATLVTETPLFDEEDSSERAYPLVSPDGKKIAYVSDRLNLNVMNLADKKERTLINKVSNYRSGGFQAAWSPDSRWLALEVMNPLHEPYTDIAIVDTETGERIDITRSGYFDERPHFTPDGKAVIFSSERYGMRNHASWGSEYDVMMAFLTREAYDKYRLSEEDYALLKEVEEQQKKDADKNSKDSDKKKKGKKGKKEDKDKAGEEKPALAIDREGLSDRIVRLTPNSSLLSDYALSSDGQTLYYLSAFEGGYDLWKKDLRKGDVSLVKKLDTGGTGIETDKDGNMYLIGRTVKKFSPKGGDIKNISIFGNVKIDPDKERQAMLQYVETEARERFYLPELPVDWAAYAANYRRFLPHINNNQDFADLLSELLGELNVSHSGGGYSSPAAKETTGRLGLLFDMTGNCADGVKVEEIVAGGPFDRATTALRPGSVITAVNGLDAASADLSMLLNNTVGRKTLVAFNDPEGKKHEEVVIPITAGAMSELLYNRWVKSRREAVDSLSGGRLGYVHIRSMSDDSFREVYSRLLGEYAGKEGIVIDTRWNGGGRLHEDIEVLFSGEKYLTQEIHGNISSEMPSRRWNKPSIMVVCEANYSNAHGTPWVYRRKGMGKIVGMPVPGTMSSVNWIRLQDPTLVFGVPVVAFRTPEGTVLENTQLEPDIKVANRPEDVARGIDAQLATAVKTLLDELDSNKN